MAFPARHTDSDDDSLFGKDENGQTASLKSTLSNTRDVVLSPAQVKAWKEEGACIIHAIDESNRLSTDGWLLTKQESERFRKAAREAVLGNGSTIQPLADQKNFGGLGFPFFGRNSEALNDLVLHPNLIQAVRQLLDLTTSHCPVLTQGECWVKRDSPISSELPMAYVNTDQRMHCDYPNHYLTHPPVWNKPEAVAMIVYLDDAEICGGRTAYVPRQGDSDEAYRYPYLAMPGVADFPWINDRQSAELFFSRHNENVAIFRDRLYRRERLVNYSVGTVLLYRLDLWHRGTPLKPDTDRAVVNLLFSKRDARHITSWHRGWATNMYNSWSQPRIFPPVVGEFERLLSALSPDQRSVLGFPPVGDSFWTYETLQAVALRYPKMDMLPYYSAFRLKTKY